MPRSNKPTILLVEDYKDSREMLTLLLEGLKYRVVAVVDGQAALHLLSTEIPDLILTDFNLPGMNGTELIRRVRRIGGRLSDMPIIMITAFGRDEVYESAMEAGCSAFFSKPIVFEVLQEAIEELLAKTREINGSVSDY